MSDSVRFARPPVIELIFGVQFSSLRRMTTAHLGWFWKELGDDWSELADGHALPDQFERFERIDQRRLRFNPDWRLGSSSARNRVSISHRDGSRLLQIQSSQFRFHWRKSVEIYPGFDRLVDEFAHWFGCFTQFIESNSLGKMLLNQWDLTYVNTFPRGGEWHLPEEWSDILPGLFGLPPVADGLVLDTRSANWSYIITPDIGRLHIAAGLQSLAGDSQDALVIRSTARGPMQDDGTHPSSIRERLNRGHDAILDTFLKISSAQIQTKWERIS